MTGCQGEILHILFVNAHPEQSRWLKTLRAMNGLKQADLAEAINVSRSYVATWEADTSTLPIPKGFLDAIVEKFPNCPPPAGISEASESAHGRVKLTPVAPASSGKIKLYGHVSAGNGNTVPFDGDSIEVPLEFARDDYGALIVDGDSMMPELLPGDVCIFRDARTPKLGAIVAAELPDQAWVVKLMGMTAGKWVLRSLNESYSEYNGPFRLGGYLVGIIRDDGPERTIRLNPFGIKLRN